MKDLKIQWYISLILKKIKFCSARYSIIHLPTKIKLIFFIIMEIKTKNIYVKFFI